jgi:hypothetical protein
MIYGILGTHGDGRFVAAVMVHDGTIAGSTAHLRWSVGKRFAELREYCGKQGWRVTEGWPAPDRIGDRHAANDAARVLGEQLNTDAMEELARWHRDTELETILDYTV